MFGYITASFASFFVGRDAASEEAETVGAADIVRLSEEIAALRRELVGRHLTEKSAPGVADGSKEGRGECPTRHRSSKIAATMARCRSLDASLREGGVDVM